MPTPQTAYDAVIHAARDVAAVETALDAEMLGAALLGGVYAIAESDSDRAEAVRQFVGRFLRQTARRRTVPAQAIRTIFAELCPDADGAGAVRPGSRPPAWSRQLGKVSPVGTWAYGDVYGDQTSYLAIFEYEEPELGGDEHAVVALIDHNIGIVKDLFVSRPGRRVLEEVQKASEADELMWVKEVEPADLRAEVGRHLEITDRLSVLPDEGSLATDRVLVGARLAVLPEGGRARALPIDVDAAAIIERFLSSPEAAELDRSTPEAVASLQYAVRLIFDFTQDSPDADPMRWSPAVAGLFLLDWVHRRAVLDDGDVAILPAVLQAWIAWCARERELPMAAAAATREAVDMMQPELVRRHGSEENRIPRPRG